MNEELSPDDIEQFILLVVRKKRRKMTAAQIAREITKRGFKVSRPTIAKYLKTLEEQGMLEF